jgi:outer membrane protein TolC
MLQLQQDLTSFQIQIAALTEHAQQLDVASTAAERAWQTNLMDWPTYLSIRSNALSADLELVALQQEQAAQAIALETLLGGDWTDRTLSVSSPHHSISKQQP